KTLHRSFCQHPKGGPEGARHAVPSNPSLSASFNELRAPRRNGSRGGTERYGNCVCDVAATKIIQSPWPRWILSPSEGSAGMLPGGDRSRDTDVCAEHGAKFREASSDA